MTAGMKPRAVRRDYSKSLDIYYKYAGVFESTGINISETGILIRTDYPIGLYAKVHMRLHLPFEPPKFLDLEASTLRSEVQGAQFLTALEFNELSTADKNILRKLVTSPT